MARELRKGKPAARRGHKTPGLFAFISGRLLFEWKWILLLLDQASKIKT